jgi:hypothetical protein
MTDESKKAIDFAADVAKQMVTLSTGIVTITLLFSTQITFGRAWAAAAWTAFLISTLAGLWTLMSLTGTLLQIAEKAARASDPSKPSHFKLSQNVLFPARLQVVTFILAVLFTIAFVISSATHKPVQAPTNDCCCNCRHS